jgi:hypothetical protein
MTSGEIAIGPAPFSPDNAPHLSPLLTTYEAMLVPGDHQGEKERSLGT